MGCAHQRSKRRLLAALLLLGACDIDCAWLTPDASRERHIGTHTVAVTAKGTRHVGMDGIAAPHAFGVLWPVIDGYGYEIRLEVDDRPEIVVGIADFAHDRLPNEDELQVIADAIEVTVSPNGEHLAYRRDATTGWRVLHMLPRGRPFDADDSDVFSARVVEADALDFASLRSARAIGLAILGSREERHHRSAFWQALADQPAGPPWDEVLLALWPEEDRAHDILRDHMKPGSGSTDAFRDAAVRKALDGLRDHPGHGEEEAAMIEATEREGVIRELETTLLTLWPRMDVRRALVGRLRRTHSDASRAALRRAAEAKAIAQLASGVPPGDPADLVRASIELVQAVALRDEVPELYAALLAHWPASDHADTFYLAHHAAAPRGFTPRLVSQARTHLADVGETGDRAARLLCKLLFEAGACAEFPPLVARVPNTCWMPARCP